MPPKSKKGRSASQSQTPSKEENQGHDSFAKSEAEGVKQMNPGDFASFCGYALRRSPKDHICSMGLHPLGIRRYATSDSTMKDEKDHFSYTFPGCSHSFCGQCLRSQVGALFLKSRTTGHSEVTICLACPSCPERISLQGQAVQDLQDQAVTLLKTDRDKDIRSKALLEDLLVRFESNAASPEKTPVVQVCGICEDKAGSVHCKDCGFALCADCKNTVHSKGRFKQHQVSALQEGATSEGMPSTASLHCTTHPNYPVELYCKPCKMCVCLMCHYAGKHKGHEVQSLDELQETLRKELHDAKNTLETKAAGLKQLSGVVANVEKDCTSVASEASSSINETFQNLIEALSTERDALLNRVDTWRKRVVATSRQDQLSLRAAVSLLEDIGVACSALPDSAEGSSTELIALAGAVKARIDSLEEFSLFSNHGTLQEGTLKDVADRFSAMDISKMPLFHSHGNAAENLAAFMNTRVGKLNMADIPSITEELCCKRTAKAAIPDRTNSDETLGSMIFNKQKPDVKSPQPSHTNRIAPASPGLVDAFNIGTQQDWGDSAKPKSISALASQMPGLNFGGGAQRPRSRSDLTFGSQANAGLGMEPSTVGEKRQRPAETTEEPQRKAGRSETSDGMDPPAAQQRSAGKRMLNMVNAGEGTKRPSTGKRTSGFSMKM